jgi:hypothetical protein
VGEKIQSGREGVGGWVRGGIFFYIIAVSRENCIETTRDLFLIKRFPYYGGIHSDLAKMSEC